MQTCSQALLVWIILLLFRVTNRCLINLSSLSANFALPEEGPVFDKVEFIELEKEESQKLVEKYNKEGRDALPPEKRFRRDDRWSNRGGNV